MNDDQFEQFIKLLDAALVSDDKKIKTALRKFMFIMALNLSDDDCDPGPFTKMMETINELQRRLAVLETKDNTWTQTKTITWPYGVGTGTPPPYIAPNTTSGQITGTGTGTTQWTNVSTATTGNAATMIAGSTTTTTNITSNGSNCLGNTGTYIINLGDEDTGTEIKNEIKDSLAKLAI